VRRGITGGDDDEAAEDDQPRRSLFCVLGWSHRDAVAFTVAVCSVVAILINALFLQTGPHPAPILTGLVPPVPAAAKGMPEGTRPASGRGQPATLGQAAANARSGPEIVADIQRELASRGFFDGVVDGRHSRRTDAAVRSFAIAAGIKSDLELNEALLAVIRRSNVRLAKASSPSRGSAPARSASVATGTTAPRPPHPIRDDAIKDFLAASKRVLAIQRVLAEFGYGQIKPTGMMDSATRSAIEKFERERNLPVTGTASDRLVKELTAVTGRQVE
jgi:peptidoglycan hydrolase-like protein with peptidoglycan-binding domain